MSTTRVRPRGLSAPPWRARFKLLAFEPIDGGAQLVIEATLAREGHHKPVCVVEQVVRQYT
jgi:hypothetical protein